MVPGTRRRFLRRATSLAAVPLAGCVGESTTSSRSEPPSLDEEDVITDASVLTRRIPDVELDPQERIIDYREGEDDSSDGDGSSDDDESTSAPRPRLPYVVADEHVDMLAFRPELPDPEGVESFLRETDYDESTVLLVEREVSACHRWELQYVEIRSSNRLAPQFCSVVRDPSVECSVDDTHLQVTVIRVPVAYTTPPPGSGLGHSSSCTLPPDHPVRETNRTGGDDG